MGLIFWEVNVYTNAPLLKSEASFFEKFGHGYKAIPPLIYFPLLYDLSLTSGGRTRQPTGQCSQKFFLKYRGAGAQIAESPVFSPRSRKSPVFRPQIAEKSPKSRASNRGFGDISPDLVTLDENN